MKYIRKHPDIIIGLIASVIFAVVSVAHIGPFAFNNIEVAGFITGAWSVWLLAKDNILNWPIGIVNGALFVYLFWDFNLYADAGINMWYVIAGIYGWYYWTHGGKDKTERLITRIPLTEAVILLAAIALGTWWMTGHLADLGDTAPFLDALTTCMSLAAFWMQARKYIENWFVWILADVIYIPLYFWKSLPVTGVLYIGFMAMCFVGLYNWTKTLHLSRLEILNRIGTSNVAPMTMPGWDRSPPTQINTQYKPYDDPSPHHV